MNVDRFMTKMDEVRFAVSVVVPVFNTGTEELKKCLLPFQENVDSRIEIILVDDGSDESVARTVDSLAEACLVRTRVVHQPNGGQNSARNTGVRCAQGKYVAFLDSDDEIDWQNFLTLVNKAERSDADVIAFKCMKVGPDSSIISDRYGFGEIPEGEWNRKTLLSRCAELWSQWFRRDYLLEAPAFPTDLRIGEDLETVFPLLASMRSFVFMPVCVYHYIDRQSGITKRASLERHLDVIKALQRIIDNPNSHFDLYREEIEWQIIHHVTVEAVCALSAGRLGLDVARRLRSWAVRTVPDWNRNPYYQASPNRGRIYVFLIMRSYFGTYLFLRSLKRWLADIGFRRR